MNRATVLGSLAGLAVAGAAVGQELRDPTTAWLENRWERSQENRFQDANENTEIPSGRGGEITFAQAEASFDMPMHWLVTAARVPEQYSDVFHNNAQIIYAPVNFGTLPADITDWFRQTPHDSIRDWKENFDRHLEENLRQGSDDFTPKSFSGDDPLMVILDYEKIPLSWTAATRWQPWAARKWEDACRIINRPDIDPEFVAMAGADVPVTTWSELERQGLVDDFLRQTYEGFCRIVVTTSLDLIRDESPPGSLVGLYGMPLPMQNVKINTRSVAAPIRQHNDALQWLYPHIDILSPALYRMPLLDPNGTHPAGLSTSSAELVENWYRVNLGEMERVRNAYAPDSKIVPFVRYHYPQNTRNGVYVDGRLPLLTPENAEAQIAHMYDFGADGAFLWGIVSDYYVRKGDASEEEMVRHLSSHWVPHLERGDAQASKSRNSGRDRGRNFRTLTNFSDD